MIMIRVLKSTVHCTFPVGTGNAAVCNGITVPAGTGVVFAGFPVAIGSVCESINRPYVVKWVTGAMIAKSEGTAVVGTLTHDTFTVS